MRDKLFDSWLWCSLFASFFDSFTSWHDFMGQAPLWGKAYRPTSDLHQEYDDLLRGTNADIYIPLWASVCKAENGSLLDQTTLAVVREYHRWGYAVKDMEKNPPDYIGQQFRFLCYLYACALHEKDDRAELYAMAADGFVQRFLLDSVKTVADGILRYGRMSQLINMADAMLSWLEGTSQTFYGVPEDHHSQLLCYEAYLHGASPAISDEEPRTIFTAGRNNCGGRCSIRAVVQDGCLIDLSSGQHIGDPSLRPCVRGRGYRRTYLSGQRLRYPMKRIGARGEGRFQRITWEEAANLVVSEWKRITENFGPGSRYVNYGTGSQGVLRQDKLMRRLMNLDGGCLGLYGTYSSLCSDFVTPYIYGDKLSGNSTEDILNSKLLILWGHNPLETRFGAQRDYYIMQAKAQGMRVIVIDPRQSDSAVALADEWVGIRPSTDGALANAMAHTIWSEGLQDQRFMDTYCLGFDREHMPDGVAPELNYYDYLFGNTDGIIKDAAWAEAITGIPADTIRRIAIMYAATKPACILQGLGNQRTGNGEQTTRGIAALTCLTGNVGIPGGGAAGVGYASEEPRPVYPIGKSDYPGVISCFLWTQAVEDGISMTREKDHIQGMERLESNIKLIFNLGSNILINQHSDINNSIRILKDTSKCEFIVCSDVFMTASARYADLILPAASFLEHDDFGLPWRTGHYILASNQVIPPIFDARNEYDWIGEVARRLGLWEQWSLGRNTAEEWLEVFYDELRQKKPELPPYEQFKAEGGYAYQNPKCYIAYEKQISDPEHHKFATPSGKIEIFSKRLYEMGDPVSIPALPVYTPCPEGPEDPLREKFPLQLIGWHTKRRSHTNHDGNDWLIEVEPQDVWIHPKDAQARDIHNGDSVIVFNDRGRMKIRAKVTERVISGVAAIAQGAWFKPDAQGTDTQGSINILTSTRPTPLAKGNPQHTNLVEIRKE